MYPDDVEKKNRGFLGYDSSALPPRDRQVKLTPAWPFKGLRLR